ncbi:Leucine Rich repeat [Novymonas esmeraldas]|uniref:Leucine Rich repeat n=1 Tax=Novymonas esmeraldas TaxID=1808958 RepID=A0AAW0F2Q7_9TRYP
MRCLRRSPGTSPLTLRMCAQRMVSLAAVMRATSPSSVEHVLGAVREQAATSSTWTLDLSALLDRSAALGCCTPPAQAQLVSRVGAALADALATAGAPPVTTLSVTLPTADAARVVRRLCRTTALLASVESLELVVDVAAGSSAAAQDTLGGTGGGDDVAALLRELAALRRSAATSSRWMSLSVSSRDTSAVAVAAPAAAAGGGQVPQRLWDDVAVRALAELVAAAPWTRLALQHADLDACQPRVRQGLWAALGSAHASLSVLDLTGMRHTREVVASGQLRQLTRLTSLDVSHTHLEEDAVLRLLRDVHDGAGGWWRLQHLGLAQCDISEDVMSLLHTQREAACVAGDAPAALESLNVSGARLSRRVAFVLAGCLMQCPRLRHLRTRHCRLAANSLEDVAAALQHAAGLQTWELCLNRCGDDGAAALAAHARCWPALTEMDLSRCRLTSASLHPLSRALPMWDRLHTLRLVGNDLRLQPQPQSAGSASGGMGGLFAYDPSYMRSYGSGAKVPTSFELDRRDREEGRQRYRGTEELLRDDDAATPPPPPMEALGEALSMCSQLKVFDVSDCAMSDTSLKHLSRHFTGAALEELRLASNPLFGSVPGLDALVELLWRTPRLAVLDLSFTALGDLGLSMLCDGTGGADGGVLKSMSGLHTLLLSSCAVGSLGWESLAAAVGELPALRHITLHHNRTSDAALVEELLHGLSAAQVLESVDVSACVTSAEAAHRLNSSAACRALRDRGVHVLA